MLVATKPLLSNLFSFRRHCHFTRIPLFRMATTTTTSTMVSSSSASGSSNAHAPLKRVGTHNGSFHCDEALGCFMIRLTNKFSNAQIIRTRDPQVPSHSIPIFFILIYIYLYLFSCVVDEKMRFFCCLVAEQM